MRFLSNDLQIELACATIQHMDWDFVGNEWAVQMLQHQVVQGTTRHAYILAGAQGIGKRTLAQLFIQALNCPSSAGTGTPCMECRTCRQIHTMQFPDLMVVETLEEKSEISIDQIRQVQQFLSLTPFAGKSKTALFLNFQQAKESAQNALLKTLEESPGSSRLIITTDSLDHLLPTIISRCEVIPLRPVPASEIAFALASRSNADGQLAELLGHISGGRYGYARLLAEEPDLLEQRSAWLNDWGEIIKMNRRQRFKYIENKLPRKMELKRQRAAWIAMIQCWMSFCRDILLSTSGASIEPMNMDRKRDIADMAQKLDGAQTTRIIHSLETAAERIEAYCNPRLVMESLMLEIGMGEEGLGIRY